MRIFIAKLCRNRYTGVVAGVHIEHLDAVKACAVYVLHAVAEESRNNAVNLDIKELLAACAELGTPVNVNIGTVYNAGVYSNR